MTGRARYLVNGSISSIRVLIALHEKGLAFEPRRLRVMREPRDTRTPAFLALTKAGMATHSCCASRHETRVISLG